VQRVLKCAPPHTARSGRASVSQADVADVAAAAEEAAFVLLPVREERVRDCATAQEARDRSRRHSVRVARLNMSSNNYNSTKLLIDSLDVRVSYSTINGLANKV
jgi:hypothetical protein